MRNMHIKRSRNFVFPTEKGAEWHRKSEAAYNELMANNQKPNLEVFQTNRHDTSMLSERMKRRLGVAV